jgi:hypothetical protein
MMKANASTTLNEFLKYHIDSATYEEIKTRWEGIVESVKDSEKEVLDMSDYYESAMEQSGFRRDLIESIQNECSNRTPRYQETKDLITCINMLIGNSNVEL